MKPLDFTVYALFRGLIALPRPLLKAAAALAAGALTAPIARRGWFLGVAIGNINRVAPKRSEREKKAILRQLAVETALNTREAARMHRAGLLERLVRTEGLAEIERALAGGRGVVLLTAHLGNFPLILACLHRRGIPVRNIGRDPSNPYLAGYFEKVRRLTGITTIPQNPSSEAARAAARWLAAGNALLLPADQFSGRGLAAPFFGYRGGTPAGPAVLARRAGCPVVPVFITRRGDGRHLLRALPAIEPPGNGNRRRDINERARLFNRVIETWVGAYPGQWLSLVTRRFR